MDCDYVSKLEGKVNTFTWINDYRRANQEQTRKFFLQITTDCKYIRKYFEFFLSLNLNEILQKKPSF